jgi:hypothetical protein
MSLTYINAKKIDKIVNDSFPTVRNKEACKQFLQSFAAKNNIILKHCSSEHIAIIVTHMRKLVKKDHFESARGPAITAPILRDIHAADERERDRYRKQPKVTAVVDSLRRSSAAIGQEFCEDDMDSLFNAYLPGVAKWNAIGVTDDNGETLKAALKANKNVEGKLFIPALIHRNHWILVIREKEGNAINVTCWDPLHDPKDASHSEVLSIVDDVTRKVHPNSSVTSRYVYGNEQTDGYTCAPRVFRKALIETRVSNVLTNKHWHDGKGIYDESVKLLAKTQKNLNKHDVEVASRSGINTRDQQPAKFDEDEKLAIALQAVYREQPNINNAQASDLARLKLNTIVDFSKTKDELAIWLNANQNTFFKPRSKQVSTSQTAELSYDAPSLG